MTSVTVPCRPLDDILGEQCAPDLMKIDTEGSEVEVLRGARAVLDAHRPMLIIEILAEMGGTPMTTVSLIQEILAPLGYRCFHLSWRGVTEASRPHSSADGRNWLMIARAEHLKLLAELLDTQVAFLDAPPQP